MIKKSLLIMLCINILMVSAADASLFSWLSEKTGIQIPAVFQPQNQQTPTIIYCCVTPQQTINPFDILYQTSISPLNTAANIKTLDSYLASRGIQTVKVHVTDANKDFYLLKGSGATLEAPERADTTIQLTTEQVRTTANILADGQINIIERIQLATIYGL
jgi:hypothetical protein